MQHDRHVYALMDLLGDVGGVSEVLVKTSMLIFGGYFAFHSSIEQMKGLYSETQDDHDHGHDEDEDEHIHENKD